MKKLLFKKFTALILTGLTVFSALPCFALSVFADSQSLKKLDINTALERVEELSDKLSGKYFTVNETYCLPPEESESGHGCDNCLNKNVIYTDWFKNRVGKVPDDISFLPRFNTPDGSHISPPAKSCAGYAMFAAWYVAADSTDENLGHMSRHPDSDSIDFTVENIKKYAKPGDVIFGERYHALVFIAVEGDKIRFTDCNATRYFDGNCFIREDSKTPEQMRSYMGTKVAVTGFYAPTGKINEKSFFTFSLLFGEATAVSYNKNRSSVKVPMLYQGSFVTKIGDRVFYKNQSVREVEIPYTVKEIGRNAFYGCVCLKKVTVPESVKKIGENAFAKCTGTVICGYSGTYAEKYAKEKRIKFVSLGEIPCRHINASWSVTRQPTVLSAGEKRLTCDKCKKVLSVSAIPFIAEGWIKQNGGWYYFKNRVVQTGWLLVDEKWYYLNENGKMAVGWVKVKEKWYYLNKSGSMRTGWLKYNEKWYYLNESGAMVTGKKVIDGKQYEFSESGVCLNP